jgi:hypothetical protein
MPSSSGFRAVAVFVALGSLPWTVACSSSKSEKIQAPLPASSSNADAAASAGWTTLLTGDWTRAPGTEGYTCVRKTNTEDFYSNGFQAINPLGTHHTLLTMGAANGPDDTTPCSAADNHPLSVFGSGVGTDPLELPEGVAIKIPKDTQLLLNLHLFNTSDKELAGTSGTRIRAIPESEVTHVAEGILAGTVAIDIPPGETTTTIGYCTMSSDVTLVAVAPHMHQLGIYEKVVAESGAEGEVVLHDAPYDFNEQSYHLIDPLNLAKGDRVRVECTHKNTTANDVKFGDSSLAEMCFAGIYRYPADGTPFICMDGFTSPGGAPPTPTL